jgi:hypothetical protein
MEISTMKTFAFKKRLQDLLTEFEVDKYTDLNSYMLAEHIMRWIEEYNRQHNVAKGWSVKSQEQPQDHYHEYILEQIKKEAK